VNNQENSNHDDLLEKATRALREANVPDGPSDELVVRVVAASEAADHQPSLYLSTAPPTLGARIKKMKTITKIAVAASVLVTTGTFFSWMMPGSQGLAFADVAKAFTGVRTARYEVITTVKDGPTQQSKALFLAPARERIEVTSNGKVTMLSVADMKQGKSIGLIPDEKLAMVYDLKNIPEASQGVGTFDKLRDLFQKAQRGEEETKSLGTKTIDDKKVIGFRISQDGRQTDIWADVATELPVRVETKMTAGVDVKVVMKDFEYDVDLDESLFSLAIPKGYRVHEKTVDVTGPRARYLANVLQLCAKDNDDVFPDKLRGEDGVEGILQRMIGNVAGQIAKNGNAEKVNLDITDQLGQGIAFFMSLPNEDRWHYAGADVKLGNAERAIFWFRPTGSETYQVIYGDLRVAEDVAEEELPKTP